MEYFIQFDPVTGERLITYPYDTSVTEEEKIEKLLNGFILVSEEDWDKLVGNYDGQIYIRNPRTLQLEPRPVYQPSLTELKETKLKAISAWTEKLITSGFIYNGVKYDSDIDTQITMQGIALNVHTAQFAEKYPDGCPVRGYDEGSSIKTIHMLSADDVLGFCAALSIHIGESKKLGWTLQQRVAQAKTKDELDAIVWAEIK